MVGLALPSIVIALVLPSIMAYACILVLSRLFLLGRLFMGRDLSPNHLCPYLQGAPPWLGSLLPWLPLIPSPSCPSLLAKLALSSLLALLAGVLLLQVTIQESREGLAVWLLWGFFELIMKVINLLNDIKYLLNHLMWIHQLLLLTVAAALYRRLQSKEGEMISGRTENDFQDRLSRKAGTPPSSPQLKEVRVVRGVRRRLGTSL